MYLMKLLIINIYINKYIPNNNYLNLYTHKLYKINIKKY